MIFKIFIGHSHPVLKQMLLFTVAKTDFSFPIYQILQYLCLLKNENEMWTEEKQEKATQFPNLGITMLFSYRASFFIRTGKRLFLQMSFISTLFLKLVNNFWAYRRGGRGNSQVFRKQRLHVKVINS